MSNTSNVVAALLSSNDHPEDLLSNMLQLNLSREDNESKMISNINKLISNSKYRKQGFKCLISIIDICSISAINKNALNWINSCLVKYSGDNLKEVKFKLLGKILQIAHNDSSFNKKFTSDYISSIFKQCITFVYVHDSECIINLQTLSVIMKHYSSWFAPHKTQIEAYLLSFLDSDNKSLVHDAAIAFHYSLQIGNAGLNRLNYKTNYTQNFHKLFRTFNKLINCLCENEIDILDIEYMTKDTFEFSDLLSNNLHVIVRRINNVISFIHILIKTKFVTAKEIKPAEVLEIIIKILSLHKCLNNDDISTVTYEFSLLLQQIQISVLHLLRLFIYWQQTNLLPFSLRISRIIVDSIEKAQQCNCFKINSVFQEATYKVLVEWLFVSKSSFNSQLQCRALSCIIKDITPIKTNVTLALPEMEVNKNSQKAKKRATINSTITFNGDVNTVHNTYSSAISQKVNTCKLALEALKFMLELTKLNIKTALLQELYRSIFNSLITLQSSEPIQFYKDPRCQIGLYEALVALYCQKPLSVLPPFQITFDILTKGLNDRNKLVANICDNGIKKLETKCQTICPSLYLKSTSIDEREVVQNDLSNRNEDNIFNTKNSNASGNHESSTKSTNGTYASVESREEIIAAEESNRNTNNVPNSNHSPKQSESDTATRLAEKSVNDAIIVKTTNKKNTSTRKSKSVVHNRFSTSTKSNSTTGSTNSSVETEQELIIVNYLPSPDTIYKEQLKKVKNKTNSNVHRQRNVDKEKSPQNATCTRKRQIDVVENGEKAVVVSVSDPPETKIKKISAIDDSDSNEFNVEDDSFVDEVIDY